MVVLSDFYADEGSSLLGRGRRKKIASLKITDQSVAEGFAFDNADGDKLTYKVNQEGRYICHLCEKTFKTVGQALKFCEC